MKKILLLVLALITLTACGPDYKGTYADENGVFELTLKDDGKAAQRTFGVEVEMEYKVEDGKVKLMVPGGGAAIVLEVNNDGTLQRHSGSRTQYK